MFNFIRNLFRQYTQRTVVVYAEIPVAWTGRTSSRDSTIRKFNGYYLLYTINNKKGWKYVGDELPANDNNPKDHPEFVHVERFLLDGYFPSKYAAKRPDPLNDTSTTNLEKFEAYMKQQGF